MSATSFRAVEPSDPESGLPALFRSKSVFAIVRYLTERHLEPVRIAALEHELRRRWDISRGAATNAIDTLKAARLVKLTKTDGNQVCEVLSPRVWAKLGELLDIEDQPETANQGMPWLAAALAEKPRRRGFQHHPAQPEPATSLEAIEAMLAILPPTEPATPNRRSPAPGRRR